MSTKTRRFIVRCEEATGGGIPFAEVIVPCDLRARYDAIYPLLERHDASAVMFDAEARGLNNPDGGAPDSTRALLTSAFDEGYIETTDLPDLPALLFDEDNDINGVELRANKHGVRLEFENDDGAQFGWTIDWEHLR